MNDLIRRGKQLSWLLRHDIDSYNKGKIDEHGWREVSEIIHNYGFTSALLNEIVSGNNKQRYEYNQNCTKIRACQGHSIPVDVELSVAKNITASNPYLYHGTTEKFIENIKQHGLLPGKRIFLHLSGDEKTAYHVGRRHGGKTCIICIDAYKMIQDGHIIYISNNGVYNTKCVDPKYFIEIKYLNM